MQRLDALTREAAALAADPRTALSPAAAEADRMLQICNACRYCEGFCAVFPAMTRRLEFGAADIHYLANLCHNCGACLHACQYAPPHEFAVNIPRAMARVRGDTYHDYAWPAAFGRMYARNGLTLALALAGSLALFFVLLSIMQGAPATRPLGADFYAIFPHRLLVALFGVAFMFSLGALGAGIVRFWRGIEPNAGGHGASRAAVNEAAADALSLHYLDGGHGLGCNESDDAFEPWRRRFHHCTFYGFVLCFASTAVATLYHYVFRESAPYPLLSVPVLLGTAGGMGLVVGTAGQFLLYRRRHPLHREPSQRALDLGFTALLFMTGLTGLALLAWRYSGAMGLLLAIHLGVVLALFVTLPYGKFAHAGYRCAALLKYAIEKRQPNRSGIQAE